VSPTLVVSATLGRIAAVAGRLQGEELARSVWRRRRWHAAPRLCAPFDIPPRPGERRYPVGRAQAGAALAGGVASIAMIR
jgi:hypothetical protein